MQIKERVPEQDAGVDPARSLVLPPGETTRVTVTLTPMAVKQYDFYLVVDVPGVGEALLSLPISAECLVPDVSVAEPELDVHRVGRRPTPDCRTDLTHDLPY